MTDYREKLMPKLTEAEKEPERGVLCMSDDLIEVARAFEVIKKAMKKDSPSVGGSYAHSWHCNIACICADAVTANSMLGNEDAHAIGNDAATRFMKLCFDVDTKA